MKIEELLAKQYLETHTDEITSIITKAFLEGYKHGLKKSREIYIDGITYYDLGLPSGTLWSRPICVDHPYSYVTYDWTNYLNASTLELPTIEDLEELKKYCMIINDPRNVAQNVVIVGPSGERLEIGTKNYLNNSSNPNSMLCRRQGENMAEFTNMFWLKSSPQDNHAAVGVVNFKEKTLTSSTYFTGFKLPYILVKKTK